MSLSTQAKLLRVLQDRSFERLGGMETIKVDIRFIVATNKDLEEAIPAASFVKTSTIGSMSFRSRSLPSGSRKEDIPELVSYFLKKFNRELKKDIGGITPEAMEKIVSYGWPGNVRQLENVLKRAMVLCQGEWILEDQIVLEKGGEKEEAEE